MKRFSVSVFALALTLSVQAALVVSPKGPGPGKEDKRVVVAADLPVRTVANDFSGVALPWKKATKRFTITRTDPVFGFEEGRAYFKIVALPPGAAGHRVELLSFYSIDFPTTLFVPAFQFLDSSRKVVGKTVDPAYEVVNGFGEHIRVAVETPSNAAFVVIYTTPARVAERMVFKTSGMTGVLPAPTFGTKDTGLGGFYEGILKMRLAKK